MARRSFRPGLAEKIWLHKPAPGARLIAEHPLARALVGCYLFNENGGIVARNIAQARNNVTAPNEGTLTGAVSYTTGRRHKGAEWTGATGSYINLANPAGFGTSVAPITISILVQPNFSSAEAVFHPLWFWGAAGAGDVQRISMRWNSGLFFFVDSAGQALGQATTTFAVGDVFLISYSNSGSAGSGQWYRDGIPLTTTNNAGTPNAVGTWVSHFGALQTDFALAWKGHMHGAWIHKRVLPAEELRALAARPFSMIEPMTPRSRVSLRAGVANALSLAGTLTLSGALTRNLIHALSLAGSVIFNGTLAADRVFMMALAGTLTFTGSLVAQGISVILRILGIMFIAGWFARIAGQLVFWEKHVGVDTKIRHNIEDIHDVDHILTKDDLRRIREIEQGGSG